MHLAEDLRPKVGLSLDRRVRHYLFAFKAEILSTYVLLGHIEEAVFERFVEYLLAVLVLLLFVSTRYDTLIEVESPQLLS